MIRCLLGHRLLIRPLRGRGLLLVSPLLRRGLLIVGLLRGRVLVGCLLGGRLLVGFLLGGRLLGGRLLRRKLLNRGLLRSNRRYSFLFQYRYRGRNCLHWFSGRRCGRDWIYFLLCRYCCRFFQCLHKCAAVRTKFGSFIQRHAAILTKRHDDSSFLV